MIDDPFVLLAYGILLLAGGMYPIGFLFGACSDCCDVCAGNLCHFHEIAGFAFRPTNLYPNISITVSIDSISTSATGYDATFIVVGSKAVSITGTVSGQNQPVTVTTIQYRYRLVQVGDGSCGLTDISAKYYISFRAVFSELNAAQFNTQNGIADEVLLYETSECAAQTITDKEFVNLSWGQPDGSGSLTDSILSYLNNVTATVSISFDACECGACCNGTDSAPALCVDNVAEHLCDGDPAEQLYKGSGSLCAEEECNSGACCDQGECYPVYSVDYCPGEFLEGVECDPNPCI